MEPTSRVHVTDIAVGDAKSYGLETDPGCEPLQATYMGRSPSVRRVSDVLRLTFTACSDSLYSFSQ